MLRGYTVASQVVCHEWQSLLQHKPLAVQAHLPNAFGGSTCLPDVLMHDCRWLHTEECGKVLVL